MAILLAQQTTNTTGLCYYSNLRGFTTFTVPAGITRLDSIVVLVRKSGTPAGTIYFQVFATSGGNPTGSALAGGSYTSGNFSTSYSWLTVDFGDIAVTPGAMYAIVQYQPSVTGTSNGVYWGHANTDYYAGGTSGYWNTSGSITGLSGDFAFQVYGYGVPTGMGTTSTSSVNNTSFTAASTVTGDSGATITQKGFVYSSVTSSPTLAHSSVVVGSGTGAFSTNISGLSAGTTYYIRSFATNAAGTSYGAVKTQATTSSAPSVSTQATTSIDKFTATFNGTVSNDNGSTITERGFVYSTTTDPVIGGSGVSKRTVSGTTGVYSYGATSLAANTTYYVKAYAINSVGTSYGTEVSFTTLSAAPSVSSSGVTNILDTTSTLNGDVTSDNGSTITERGFVYSTSVNPTTANNKTTVSGTTGTYSVGITGLTAGTVYHYRAYAINAYGTSYGSDVEFTTEPTEPDSLVATAVGKTQIDLTWNKGNGSTYTIIRRDTGDYPTTPTGGTDVYSGVGSSTSDTGLIAGTTYYYRAWAREGSTNYSTDTADNTGTTHHSLTNPSNTYSEDSTYATAPAADNKVYIKLSGDGGSTWSNELEGTLPASNGVVAFGSSGTQLWGKTWTGTNVNDTNFRVMITLGSDKTSYQIFKTFGFSITSSYIMTGIEVNVKGYFDTDTAYIDGLSVQCNYGTSVLPVTAGTQAYDETTGRMAYFDGTNWKQLANTDDA